MVTLSNIKNFNVDNVRVVKIMGGTLSGSTVVRGMVFGREPEGKLSVHDEWYTPELRSPGQAS